MREQWLKLIVDRFYIKNHFVGKKFTIELFLAICRFEYDHLPNTSELF